MNLRKTVFYSFILSLFAFASCKGPGNNASSLDISLRESANGLQEQIVWANEIENHILSEKIKGSRGAEGSVSVTPKNVFASGAEKDYAGIYPVLKGFASLDVSMYPGNSLSFVSDFCNSLPDTEKSVSFMDKGNVFVLSLFYYDLNLLYPEWELNSFKIGSCFESDSYIQCPVRLFVKVKDQLEFCDVYVYLVEKDCTYKVSLLEFIES